MILLVFEISVDPVKSQEIQRLSRNTATFFGIDDVINFAVCHSKITHLLKHIDCDFIIVVVNVTLHLLQLACSARLEVCKQYSSDQVCFDTVQIVHIFRVVVHEVNDGQQYVPTTGKSTDLDFHAL